MSHVGLHEVTGRKSRAKTEFSSEDTSCNNTSELPCVISRICGVWSTHTEQIEHGGLRLEDGSSTNRADFDTRHRYGNLKATTQAARLLVVVALKYD